MILVHKVKDGFWRIYENGIYRDEKVVCIKDVNFFVNVQLQDLSRKENIKYPHAYAVGELVNPFLVKDVANWQECNYDVFSNDHFILNSGELIVGGKFLLLDVCAKIFNPIFLKNK